MRAKFNDMNITARDYILKSSKGFRTVCFFTKVSCCMQCQMCC